MVVGPRASAGSNEGGGKRKLTLCVVHLDFCSQKMMLHVEILLLSIIPNQIPSLSLTKIEELTAGSDEKTQRSQKGDNSHAVPVVASQLSG